VWHGWGSTSNVTRRVNGRRDITQEEQVEIKVGIQQINRELVIETSESAVDVENSFAEAVAKGGLLTLTDERGRKVLIQASSIGYLDVGEENTRHVGFGSV